MGFDWEAEANGEGGGEKIPNGIHFVTGSKVIQGKGNKGPWLLLVFEDKQGREGSTVLSLTDKGSWTLARWLSRCGEDLKAMESEGVEPKHFTNDDIANQYLVGASCWVEIKDDPKNPEYKSVMPLTEADATAKGAKVEKAPVGSDFPTDSIPFGFLAMLIPSIGILVA